MKSIVVLGTLMVGSLVSPALSAGIQVVQTRAANVYGTVQAGAQVQPTSVTQTGRANMAGIVQAGSGAKSASVTQTGKINGTVISQMRGRNSATVTQRMP